MEQCKSMFLNQLPPKILTLQGLRLRNLAHLNKQEIIQVSQGKQKWIFDVSQHMKENCYILYDISRQTLTAQLSHLCSVLFAL